MNEKKKKLKNLWSKNLLRNTGLTIRFSASLDIHQADLLKRGLRSVPTEIVAGRDREGDYFRAS